jgi:hypothetical protein
MGMRESRAQRSLRVQRRYLPLLFDLQQAKSALWEDELLVPLARKLDALIEEYKHLVIEEANRE